MTCFNNVIKWDAMTNIAKSMESIKLERRHQDVTIKGSEYMTRGAEYMTRGTEYSQLNGVTEHPIQKKLCCKQL